MDYDDFAGDNNPFAGSNHYFSNGILNATDTDIDAYAYANTVTPHTQILNSIGVNNVNKNANATTHGDIATFNHNYRYKDTHIDNLNTSFVSHGSNIDDEMFRDADNNVFLEPATTTSTTAGKHTNTAGVEQEQTENEAEDEEEAEDEFEEEDEEDEDEDDKYEAEEANNTSMMTFDPPTIYNPTLIDSPATIVIKNFEIIKDFKGTRTVYYKIFNLENESFVLRRYNDFKSLRVYLCKFFPYMFIPPIPERHSLSRFLKNPFSYKNDVSIIELRTRLLNYFLAKLTFNKEISKSAILLKFLDPLTTNWETCLKFPPFTNLSSNSLLLVSTRNPSKPSPYFSFLPIPPTSLVKNFRNEINQDIFHSKELKLKHLLKFSVNLEKDCKKLIHLLTDHRMDLVEFGGFLNIFSIVENQNLEIEKFGNKIDLNFLNIEILVNNLIIKIKEPIIVLKNSVIYLLQLLHFRKMKDLQLDYFSKIIQKKQKKLISLIKSIRPDIPQQKVDADEVVPSFLKLHSNSPSLNLAIENLKKKEEQNRFKHRADKPKVSSIKTPSERQAIIQEIKVLNNELNKNLIPCFQELKKDVVFLNTKIEESCNDELTHLIRVLNSLITDWKTSVWGEYVQSCVKIWSNNSTNKQN